MRRASQLPGRGPTDANVPLYLRVNQKSNDDDADDDVSLGSILFAQVSVLVCQAEIG